MKPAVIIDLEPVLQDFLYHEFKAATKGDGVEITSKNDIGRFVQAMISVSDRPPKQELKDNPITLLLPIQEWNHHIFDENFIFIPEWKQQMIRNYIESSFRLRIREYFVAGYEKGYKQDKIVNAFLLAYNIKKNAISYDAIKKYDYRNRKKIIQAVNNDIQMLLDF